MHRNSDMASRSLRVLGVAYKDVTELPSGEKNDRKQPDFLRSNRHD